MLMKNFIIEAIRRKDCNKCSYVWECKKYRVQHGSNMCVYHAKKIEDNSIRVDKENEVLEMDCLVCNLSEENKCFDCCKNWDEELGE